MRWLIVTAAAVAVLGALLATLASRTVAPAPRPVSCHQTIQGPVPSPQSAFQRALERAPCLGG